MHHYGFGSQQLSVVPKKNPYKNELLGQQEEDLQSYPRLRMGY